MPFDHQGLTNNQASDNLQKYGPNILPEKKPPTDIEIFASQLKSPLVYVLAIAGVITIFLSDYKDSLVIFFAVFINTIFGFIQERRANKALVALKKMMQPTANVIREGSITKISVEQVVPEDYVIIRQGDKVGADGELAEVNRLLINESMLTGESVAVGKKVGNKVYMGTIVSTGQGLFRVESTGVNTQMGSIAESMKDISFDTPLRRQLTTFSRHLVILVLFLTVFVIFLGLLQGTDFLSIFTTSVALAVSAIPEGLLVALTVVLAIGMQRILDRKGLVRNLVSAETLGGVTTICSDKTGTLTKGIMEVTEVVGEETKIASQVIIANDLDDPMVIAAYEWAKQKVNVSELSANHKRVDSIPFSSEERFFASLNKEGNRQLLYVSGAPEYLTQWSTLTKVEKENLLEKIEKLTKAGKRLVAFAYKKVNKPKTKIEKKDVISGLTFSGLLAFVDPIREGVKESLEKTKRAGVRLIVITGDYPQTANFVLKTLGHSVSSETTMLGSELEKLSVKDLSHLLARNSKEVFLFARTTPQQKLKIVESLKNNGEVVAMMGDGVNDAPALAKADIGVVVGDATDVAKEASDLVLLDSSFQTIVAAVEEGRRIFDNIRKVTLYLLCDAFGEITAVVVGLILGMPLPVSAAQILWINIVSDGFPSVALTVDPSRQNIMATPPRDQKELLVAPWMRALITVVSLSGGLAAVILFAFTYTSTSDISLARSTAFASLGINSLFYVFSVRNLREPVWKTNFFSNKLLVMAVIAGFLLHLSPFLIPSLGSFLNVVALPMFSWLLVFIAAILMIVIIEFSKVILRRKLIL